MAFRFRIALATLALILMPPMLTAQAAPRGIYAVVSILDEIKALQTANPSAAQKQMDGLEYQSE
jgi:hypothetical protein